MMTTARERRIKKFFVWFGTLGVMMYLTYYIIEPFLNLFPSIGVQDRSFGTKEMLVLFCCLTLAFGSKYYARLIELGINSLGKRFSK